MPTVRKYANTEEEESTDKPRFACKVTEKLEPGAGPGARRYVKREAARALRRAGRALGEDAPAAVMNRGWFW